MSTTKPKFAEGEKVLCFHGPLIYEAKALKSTIVKEKQIKYLIHYAGWNKNWDEWVPENRVLKFNDANVQRQQDLFRQHRSATGKSRKNTPKGKKSETIASKEGGASSGGSESRASTPSKDLNSTPLAAPSTSGRSNRGKQTAALAAAATVLKEADTTNKEDNSNDELSKDEPGKKKRGRASSSDKSITSNSTTTSSTPTPVALNPNNRMDSFADNEDSFLSKIEVKIKIPDDLKQCLVDDWDAITRQHKLLDIPANITVQDIVDQYIAHKKAHKAMNAAKEVAINDVLNGIVEYFNVMLGSQLLYKFERPQYAEILQKHPETPLSKIYGSYHLLRLFVKLGNMLGFSALDEKSLQLLLFHLHDFLKFLVKNTSTFFHMSNFVNVSLEYHRNTQ